MLLLLLLQTCNSVVHCTHAFSFQSHSAVIVPYSFITVNKQNPSAYLYLATVDNICLFLVFTFSSTLTHTQLLENIELLKGKLMTNKSTLQISFQVLPLVDLKWIFDPETDNLFIERLQIGCDNYMERFNFLNQSIDFIRDTETIW